MFFTLTDLYDYVMPSSQIIKKRKRNQFPLFIQKCYFANTQIQGVTMSHGVLIFHVILSPFPHALPFYHLPYPPSLCLTSPRSSSSI